MKQALAEIEEMKMIDVDDLLYRVGYGHFACALDDQPYIVPINYAYEKPNIYFYTTEGKKTAILKSNPLVCLQVEEVVDSGEWRSVVVMGAAEQIFDLKAREEVIRLILERNPTLTPAISVRWVDNWIRENVEAVYRIIPNTMSGRSATNLRAQAAFAQSGAKNATPIQ